MAWTYHLGQRVEVRMWNTWEPATIVCVTGKSKTPYGVRLADGSEPRPFNVKDVRLPVPKADATPDELKGPVW